MLKARIEICSHLVLPRRLEQIPVTPEHRRSVRKP